MTTMRSVQVARPGDLKQIAILVLLMHGDDDQIVPIDTSPRASAKLRRSTALKIYPGRRMVWPRRCATRATRISFPSSKAEGS